jgi:hypothetical protein
MKRILERIFSPEAEKGNCVILALVILGIIFLVLLIWLCGVGFGAS